MQRLYYEKWQDSLQNLNDCVWEEVSVEQNLNRVISEGSEFTKIRQGIIIQFSLVAIHTVNAL